MTDFILTHAKIIAMLGFFAGFVWIVATVLRPSRKQEFDAHAQIPFKEPE